MAITLTMAFLKKEKARKNLSNEEDNFVYCLEKCFNRDLFNDDGTPKTYKLTTLSPFSKIEFQSRFKAFMRAFVDYKKWCRVCDTLKAKESENK